MEFIVVDKNTIENITDKKKWILGPNGDLEYIDKVDFRYGGKRESELTRAEIVGNRLCRQACG